MIPKIPYPPKPVPRYPLPGERTPPTPYPMPFGVQGQVTRHFTIMKLHRTGDQSATSPENR
jgi:hypothetical protein